MGRLGHGMTKSVHAMNERNCPRYSIRDIAATATYPAFALATIALAMHSGCGKDQSSSATQEHSSSASASAETAGSTDNSAIATAAAATPNSSASAKPVAAPAPASSPLVRGQLVMQRSLLAEAPRAELERGGVLIDMGSADQHKYSRGGWGSGWSGNARDGDGPTYATMNDKQAWLTGMIASSPREILIGARASGDKAQTVRVQWNQIDVGRLQVAPTWGVSRLELKESVIAKAMGKGLAANGLHQWKLDMTRSGSTPILVDWVHLAGTMGQAPQAPRERVAVLRVGNRPKRTLMAAVPQTYSFYLHIPDKAQFVFDAGAESDADFRVRLRTSDGTSHELWQGQVSTGAWQEVAVDLARFAKQAVRLELETTGHSKPVGWGEPALMVPEAPAPVAKVRSMTDTEPAKNLVWIVLDTTRVDLFAPFAPDNITETPNFDNFAEKSTVFANAYNNENWTKPSVTTMLSSLYPGTHDARWATSNIPEEIVLLPQHLKKYGFISAAFLGNAVISDKFGFDRGWDLFRNESRTNDANSQYLYPKASKWLRENHDKRFFLYIQSIDPHTPYEVPLEYSQRYFKGKYNGVIGESFVRDEQVEADRNKLRLSERDLEWIWALYRGEATYQDHYLGGFLRELEELGILDETLVVITNDHGEELKDHGHMGHGWTLYDEMIQAPMIMRFPPMFPAGGRVEDIVEHVDVAPTVLEVLGLPPMSDTEGMSFVSLLTGAPEALSPRYTVAWSRNGMRSLRVGDWKLIAGKTQGWLRLYDLETDAKEAKDRKSRDLVAGRMCEVYLGEALASPGKLGRLQDMVKVRKHKSREIELDEQTKRQLEALGYL